MKGYVAVAGHEFDQLNGRLPLSRARQQRQHGAHGRRVELVRALDRGHQLIDLANRTW
jgi:hypothetical protein